MFEKEITSGNHVSYHFCVDKFGNNFNSKSKHFLIDNFLSTNNLNLSKYECSITTENTTCPGNYFHISYLNRNDDYIEENILRYFNINVNFPVLYFTKKFPIQKNFKCGFHLNTYRKFNSKYFYECLSIVKKFKNLYTDIIFAGDFLENGEFVDDSINIEIVPLQSKQIYFLIRDILRKNFEVDERKLNLYDKKFKNYQTDDFSWHIKIKLGKDKCVKFYRTYPYNPYLTYNYYNDRD
jgi:hypothetical protein